MSVPPLERIDRPYDVIALETRNINNEKRLNHVNSQNDYLSRRNRDLEAQLESSIMAESNIRRHATNADFEKAALSESLKDVDRMAKRLQLDKETVIEVADRELAEAKLELSRSRKELERQDLELSTLRAELSHSMEDNKHFTNNLTSQTNEMAELEALVDKLQDDKLKLSARVNRLISTEKELVMELEKVRRRKGGVKADAKRGRSPNRFDQFIKNLEQDRDYWKGEVTTLQQLLKYRQLENSARSPSRSLSRGRSRGGSRSPSPMKSSAVREGRLESALKATEEERDYYKREFELQKSLRSRPSTKLSATDKPATGNSELRRVMRERDELQTLLDKFERHMAEIQTNVKVLTGERDRLAELYEGAKEELKCVRHDLLRKAPSKTSSLTATHVLKRVEEERDEALVDLRRIIVERDSLRERLKISSDSQIADKAHLEQQVEDLNTRLRVLHNDKNQLDMQVSGLKTQINALEEELRLQTNKYTESVEECDQHKASINRMRMTIADLERSVSEYGQKLLGKEDELESTMARCRDLEGRLSNSDKLCTELRHELDQVNSSLSAVSRDKDNVVMQFTERSERCHRLDSEVRSLEETANQLHNQSKELARKLEGTEEMLRRREIDCTSLKKKLDDSNAQVENLNHSRNSTLRESRMLEEDVVTLSEENRRLSEDLQALLTERKQLSAQVQEYVAEVRRVEEVLAQKTQYLRTMEDERSRLLEQYRVVSMEAEGTRASVKQLEGDKSKLKAELINRDGQIQRLHEKIAMLDKECHQNHLAQQALEGQLSKNDKSIASLEDKLRCSEQEKYSLKNSVSDLKDAASNLENDRDATQRHLVSKEMELEKAHSTMHEMEREINMLKERCNGDRQRLMSLEQVLAVNRDQEFQSKLSLQESASEVQLMKDRLTLNETKVDSQTRELGQLRNRIAELEADLERARRQITNERFEKERIAQELRRVNDRMGGATPLCSRSGRTTPLTSADTSLSPNRLSVSPSGLTRHRTATSSHLSPAAAVPSGDKNSDSRSLTEWIKVTERKVAAFNAAASNLSAAVS
ncbi:testis-specific gene 10 protein-like isoform X2 [Watersipora subatra]|uniref:testis-specific gene 10 protein-like isoform X2 n=1 Tax=Watersipora subatra TaxID=2589382 RepID=UPI00355BFE56